MERLGSSLTDPNGGKVGASSRNRALLLWLFPLVFLILFYFLPLTEIFRLSFERAEDGIAVAIMETLAASRTTRLLSFTLGQAVLSTVLTMMIGLPGAYVFARYQFRGKSLLRALTTIAFVLPAIVVATAFNALLGPRGWVNLSLMEWFSLDVPPLTFSRTLTAILAAHIFYNLSLAIRFVVDAWQRLNPELPEAASALGANSWRVFRSITLPLLRPSILAASLLVFLFSFTSFGVILILGGPRFATLEVEIYYQTVSLFNLPTAATLALLQLSITLFITVIYARQTRNMTTAQIPSSSRRGSKPIQTWPERIFVYGLLAVLIGLLVLPLLALVSQSVFGGSSMTDVGGSTLENYRALLRQSPNRLVTASPIIAIRNSLLFAGTTFTLALLLGLPAAWALARRSQAVSSRMMDPLLMLPIGTSAITLGLGFIVALDAPPLNLRSSILLIPLAHTLVAFPFVVRALTPALRSINRSLAESMAVLGASPFQTALRLEAPLIGRSILVAGVFAFMISMGEFGASTMVARPEYPTVPVLIFRYLSRPGATNYGQALAMSTVLMLITGVGILAIERLRVAGIGEF